MKSEARKYFVSVLSVMLIFSNFSFATTLMLCKMNMGGGSTCQCSTTHERASELALKNIKNNCCDLETIELSNSNLLLSVKNDLNDNSIVLIDLFNNGLSDNPLNTKDAHYLHCKYYYHLPNSDIPVENSSLLI